MRFVLNARPIPFVLLAAFLFGACAPKRVLPPEAMQFSVRPGPYAQNRNLSEIDTLAVGDHPKSVSISPDQKTVYVCNLEQGCVDAFSTDTGRRTWRLKFKRTPVDVISNQKLLHSFEEKPVEIAFTGDGRYVWISLLNAHGVVVLDTWGQSIPAKTTTRSAQLIKSGRKGRQTVALRFIATGEQPKIIAVAPNETHVLVANWMGRSVSVVNPITFSKIRDIAVDRLPRGVCFSNGNAYVANFGSHTLSEINLQKLERTRTFRNVGKNPRHLVTSPNGESIYLSNHGDAFIREINLANGRVERQCRVGHEPRTIALSRRQNFLFVANYADDTLSVVDLKKWTLAKTVPTLARPIGISVDTRSDTVWVSGYWARAVRRYHFATELQNRT